MGAGNTELSGKLLGGQNRSEGYLLVNGFSVCSEGVGLMEGNVLCRELCGDDSYASVLRGRDHFGDTANLTRYPFRYTNVDCKGYESSFSECSMQTGNVVCSSLQGVGLRCHEAGSGSNAGTSSIFV